MRDPGWPNRPLGVRAAGSGVGHESHVGGAFLRCPYARRHAQLVRHATQEDLDRLEALLVELRGLPQLRERKRGYFSRGSRAFLHFHEDAGDLYVDVRLGSEFQRMKVTGGSEQAEFLSQVREALWPAS